MYHRNKRDEEIDNECEAFFDAIAQSIGVKIQSKGSTSSSSLGGPISMSVRFPTKNYFLQGSKYLFQDSKRILHFTSLEVLFSIINEGGLRLYSLNNSDDKEEYSYAAGKLALLFELFGYNETYFSEFIKRIKSFSYTLSCTQADEYKNRFFWEKYGKNGHGIAIEFEVINEPLDWEFFYISRVRYGELEEINDVFDNWIQFQKSNPKNTYDVEFNQLLCLHKSLNWREENEIRLLIITPDRFYDTFRKNEYQSVARNNNGLITYFSLPLIDMENNFRTCINQKSIFWNKAPKLKISKVYLGPNIKNDSIIDLATEIKQYCGEKLNMRYPEVIIISNSDLED